VLRTLSLPSPSPLPLTPAPSPPPGAAAAEECKPTSPPSSGAAEGSKRACFCFLCSWALSSRGFFLFLWNLLRCASGACSYTSHVTRHTSHVTRHTSHVTRHTSHVTRHTSHVTRHLFHGSAPSSIAFGRGIMERRSPAALSHVHNHNMFAVRAALASARGAGAG
jgi:hypothetical protein